MTTTQSRDNLNSAIAEVGRQVLTNSELTSETLTMEQVAALKSAGLTDEVIGHILREEGLDEGDVAGFTTGTQTIETGIIAFTRCVLGTCPGGVTIVVSCTPSTLPPVR